MEKMKIFNSISNLAKYTFSNNLSVIGREWYLITFNDWSEAIVTFHEEYFV